MSHLEAADLRFQRQTVLVLKDNYNYQVYNLTNVTKLSIISSSTKNGGCYGKLLVNSLYMAVQGGLRYIKYLVLGNRCY